VVIGGETENEDIVQTKPLVPVLEEKTEQIMLSNKSDSDESNPQNKPLNDVWLFDTELSRWKEIAPAVKVQPSFNSKKMHKKFEPRMAHSANVIGNYIVIYGGYNSHNGIFSPNNFYVLSLSGCTDFILTKSNTL
jgi:hypothetical protein